MLALATPRKPAPVLALRGAWVRTRVRPNAFGNALGESIKDEITANDRIDALVDQMRSESAARYAARENEDPMAAFADQPTADQRPISNRNLLSTNSMARNVLNSIADKVDQGLWGSNSTAFGGPLPDLQGAPLGNWKSPEELPRYTYGFDQNAAGAGSSADKPRLYAAVTAMDDYGGPYEGRMTEVGPLNKIPIGTGPSKSNLADDATARSSRALTGVQDDVGISAGSTGGVPYPQYLRDVGLPVGDTLGQVNGTSRGNTSSFSVSDAVNGMMGRFKQSGDPGYGNFQCGSYTRQAIEDGLGHFIERPAPASNGIVAGADYGPGLISAGFQVIAQEGYRPQLGDVIIWNRIPYHDEGHMQMYTPQGWGSDRLNRDLYPNRGIIYPANPYQGHAYTIYRYPQ
jgi:hypothetical protein